MSIIPNQTTEVCIDERNHSVTCQTIEGTVKLTLKWFVEPGDSFSRLVGNSYTFFKNNQTIGENVRKKILIHLDETEAAIGVVASPSFESIERLEAVLLFVATELKALIFNGAEMLDSLGEVVS